MRSFGHEQNQVGILLTLARDVPVDFEQFRQMVASERPSQVGLKRARRIVHGVSFGVIGVANAVAKNATKSEQGSVR